MPFLYTLVPLLAAAVIFVPVARRLGFGSVLGYLAAGLVIGPAGLRLVTDVESISEISELGVVMLLSRAGFEADNLDDYRGLNQRSPWWAFVMLLVMFSLAGLPPTVGFYGKFAVIEAAVNAGLLWLAVVAVLTSLIGAFYYLRIVKLMYFDDPADSAVIHARRDTRALLSANGIALLVLGILPQPLMGLCVIALNSSGFL